MHTKSELDITARFCERKIDDILKDKGEEMTDLEYVRHLQTLTKLKAAAESKEGL